MERAVILETMSELQADSLPGEIVHLNGHSEARRAEAAEGPSPGEKPVSPFEIEIPEEGLSLSGLEKQVIKQALNMAENNQTKASKLLKISRDTLRYKIKKYRL